MKTKEIDGELVYKAIKFSNIKEMYEEYESSMDKRFLKHIKTIEDSYFNSHVQQFYIVKKENEIVGFFILIEPIFFYNKTMILTEIFIREDFRNKGYASQIFKFLYNYSKKSSHIKELKTLCNFDQLLFFEEYGMDVSCISKTTIVGGGLDVPISLSLDGYFQLCLETL